MKYSEGDTLVLEDLGEVEVIDTDSFKEKVQIDRDGTERWVSIDFIEERIQEDEEDRDIDEIAAESLANISLLTEREAELYILHVKFGKSLDETAEEMGIKPGNCYGKWDQVKEKIREASEIREKAEKTEELTIP